MTVLNIVVLLGYLIFPSSGNEWTYLFNGKDLNNFEVLNGTAEFHIEDGAVVGESKINTPNTFLSTKAKYSNFILEFEVLIDVGLNSGVQIRSISDPEISEGRVHGYQVEIETSERKWAGGIYDESRRGWLYPLSINETGQDAFENGQWNHYHIEAIGPNIRTWVNGVPCARLVDDMTSEGLIAFQVHGIHDSTLIGKQVRWKEVRIREVAPDKKGKGGYSKIPEVSYLVEQLSEQEVKLGWRLPFVSISASDAASPDMMIEDAGDNYILEFDFQVSKGGKGNVTYSDGHEVHLAYQLADDASFPNELEQSGALRDLIAPGNLSEPQRESKRFWGAGSWNKARIVRTNDHVEHWLNNIKVLQYDLKGARLEHAVETYNSLNDLQRPRHRGIHFDTQQDETTFRTIKILTL